MTDTREDILDRLEGAIQVGYSDDEIDGLIRDAADEIRRLRKESVRLEQYANELADDLHDARKENQALRALEGHGYV